MNARGGLVASSVLTDEILAGIRDRAPGYDQRNEFFHEDLSHLKLDICQDLYTVLLCLQEEKHSRLLL